MGTVSVQDTTLGTGATPGPLGLQLDDDLTFEQWVTIGRRLSRIVNASRWWVADWLFHGQWKYGEKYTEAIAVTGLDHQTLRHLNYVAGRFDQFRRRNDLSLSHHLEVASLSLVDQDIWLDRAEAEGWSQKELREQVRAELRPDHEQRALSRPIAIAIDTANGRLELRPLEDGDEQHCAGCGLKVDRASALAAGLVKPDDDHPRSLTTFCGTCVVAALAVSQLIPHAAD